MLFAETGVLGIIAGVFIWNTVTSTKTTGKVLGELQTNAELQKSALENLSRTSENMTTALNIIQNTLAAQTQLLTNNAQAFERHDQRAEHMNADVRKMLALLEMRPCVLEGEKERHPD